MIAPETEAMFVERFLQREATSKQTLAVKAQEKERGHDWVVPCDTVGCTEIIAVCREIAALQECVVDARRDFSRAYIRAKKAEAALAEALKIISPLMKVTYLYAPVSDRSATDARNAASAFAAKHGGRDG